jgi:1-deoxy-D-xylulose-5-phosphate synthase
VGNNVVEASAQLEKENIHIAHYDIRFLKPLDNDLLHLIFRKFKSIVTVEDGTVKGGLGSAVLEFMSENNYSARVVSMGIPDSFIEQGSISELQAECGFDAEGIASVIRSLIKK